MHSRNDKDESDGGEADVQRKQASRSETVSLPCPLCNGPIELADREGPQETVCPSCGLSCLLDTAQLTAADEAVEEVVAGQDDDFGQWLSGGPIQVRRRTNVERFSRWCRENPVLLGTIVLLLGILCGITLTTSLAYVGASKELVRQQEANRREHAVRVELQQQMRQANRRVAEVDRLAEQIESKIQKEYQTRLDEAERQFQQADQQRRDAQHDARSELTKQLAQRAEQLDSLDPSRSLLLAAEALEVALQTGDRPVAIAHQLLRDRIHGFDGLALRGHDGRITSVKISSDGRWLASGSFDGTARLWDLNEKNPAASSIALPGHSNCVTAVAFSRDNRWLATAGSDSTARLWDLTSGRPNRKSIVLRGHQGRISFLGFSGDGHWLITSSSGLTQRENATRLWDLSSPRPDQTSLKLPSVIGATHDVVISPDSHTLATAGEKGDIYLWDLTHPDPTRSPAILRGSGEPIASIAFSADGRWLAGGSSGLSSRNDTVRIWDLRYEKSSPPRVVGRHEGGIRQVLLSDDGRWLVATGQDGTSRVWDLSQTEANIEPIVLHGHNETIQAAAIDPSSQWLVTAAADGTVRLWSLGRDGPEDSSVVLRTDQGSLAALAIHPDGRLLATAGDDHTIRLWNLRLRELVDLAHGETRSRSQVAEKQRQPPKKQR